MEKPETSQTKPQEGGDAQTGGEQNVKTLAQKYKDYENQKELVKDDNPYRYNLIPKTRPLQVDFLGQF